MDFREKLFAQSLALCLVSGMDTCDARHSSRTKEERGVFSPRPCAEESDHFVLIHPPTRFYNEIRFEIIQAAVEFLPLLIRKR